MKHLRIELADERASRPCPGERGRCLPPARTAAEMPCLLHSGPVDAIRSLPAGKAGSGFKHFHVNSSERTGRLCCLESSCCFKTPSFLDSWKGQSLHVPHSFTPEGRLSSWWPAAGLCSRRGERLASAPRPWHAVPLAHALLRLRTPALPTLLTHWPPGSVSSLHQSSWN